LKITGKQLFFILLLVFTIIVFVWVEVSRPVPVVWKPTFSRYDKQPYGAYLVYERLGDVFPNQTLQTLRKTLYEARPNLLPNISLKKYNKKQKTSQPPEKQAPTLLFVQQRLKWSHTDKQVLERLLEKGSTLFIATTALEDSLAKQWQVVFKTTEKFADSTLIHWTNDPQRIYTIRNYGNSRYIDLLPNAQAEILAVNAQNQPVLVKIAQDNGTVLLCSQPLVFTNYNLLRDNNAELIEKILQQTPLKPVFWDEYHKVGKETSGSPLRFILSDDYLATAFWMALTGIFLYMLVASRRKQRIIPIIPPLENSSWVFAKTIAQLYFQRRDFKDLATKKILYLADFLRQHLFLRQVQWDNDLASLLVAKTGHPPQAIHQLIQQIQRIETASQISETDLLKFNQSVEELKQAIRTKR